MPAPKQVSDSLTPLDCSALKRKAALAVFRGFARDLAVRLAGHDMLKARGITLILASSPSFFVEDTPTAVLVRQVLGAVAQFDKARTVAKLAAARKRKRGAGVKCEATSLTPSVALTWWRWRGGQARRKPKGGKLRAGSSGPSQ